MKPYARRATLRGAANGLTNARPTAVNLRWAVDRLMARYLAIGDLSEDGDAIADAMRAEADAIVFEATEDHGRLATFGLDALVFPPDRPLNILTHCNTGPLACGQFGTALGVVQAAHQAERPVHVWVDETRPYLQGARLTAWELAQAGVPHTLLPDVAAGDLMASGEVDVVIVGADRIAANGDTANKVGTYPLAVLAARHGIPFYVAAPISTVDLETPDGAAIPIEERKASEVLQFRGVRIAPPDTAVRNPSFDVTPAELITGIVTDEGVVRAPYVDGLAGRGREPCRAPGGDARRSASGRPPDGVGRAGSAVRGDHGPGHHGPGAPARVPRPGPAVRGVRDLRSRGARVRADALGRGVRRRRADRGRPGVHGTHAAAPVRDGPAGRRQRRPARRDPAAGRLHRGPDQHAAGGRGPLPRGPRPADGPDVGGPDAGSGRTRPRSSASCRSRSAS